MLRPLSAIFNPADHSNLLAGLSEPDDAAVYQIDEARAIISTTDFFPPVVDDPYAFGTIAAANALSDVYAMGGRPLIAINLVAYPDSLGIDILSEILRGGAEKVREAGAVIAGGHTVTDKEPKYGLAVTGEVHPGRILRKSGAKPGDALILTKPLGAGVITTALKRGAAHEDHVADAVRGMSHLNRRASEAALAYDVHAMTDITGYGLLGHAHEMIRHSQLDFVLRFDGLLFYDGARDYARQDIFAGGMYRNRDYYSPWCSFRAARSEADQGLLYDPQTSGGLLIAVSNEEADDLLKTLLDEGERAALIGEVTSGTGRLHVE